MRFQDIVSGIGILILTYLILSNWQGTNALLTSSLKGGTALVKTLQGR